MINYQAPNPYPQKNWLSSFLSSSESSGASIGKVVLPAQWQASEKLSTEQLLQLASKFQVTLEAGYIGTHDGATLETMQLTPAIEYHKPLSNQRFIIKFNGNGMQFSDVLDRFAYDANHLKETVIAFNYRGVGDSQKTPVKFQDLVTDGIAQVQRLLDENVNPKNITLDGLSLGGAVATMVAYHFHQLGKPVYLWNDRSFASLPKVAAEMLAPNFPGSVAACEVTTSSVMKVTGWDVDVAAAYNAIPKEFKGYMVVAKESKDYAGDGVIPHEASLHRGVREFEKKSGINTGHKALAHFGVFSGHNTLRHYLISKENVKESAQNVFEQFETRKLGR